MQHSHHQHQQNAENVKPQHPPRGIKTFFAQIRGECEVGKLATSNNLRGNPHEVTRGQEKQENEPKQDL